MSGTPTALLSPSTPDFKFPSPAASTPFLRPGDVRDITNFADSSFFSPGTPEFPSPPATPMMKPTPLTKITKKPIIDYSPIDSSPPTPTFSSPPKSMHLLQANTTDRFEFSLQPLLLLPCPLTFFPPFIAFLCPLMFYCCTNWRHLMLCSSN